MRDLTQIARAIFKDTLAAIDIASTMQRKIWRQGSTLCWDSGSVDLNSFSSVRVVAMGKASHGMLAGLLEVLGSDLSAKLIGVLAAPTPPATNLAGFQYFVAGHPLPNDQSFAAAKAILELLRQCDEHTLVFFLLSGGGSALVELPFNTDVTLIEVQQMYRALVGCGASIDEINTVRKHFSAVKGGRLAVAAGRARKITLAITDVPVGRESALASGPTLPDASSIADVETVVRKYRLATQFPAVLQRWHAEGRRTETPKPGDSAFENAQFLLLLGLDDLFHKAHYATAANGFEVCCDNTTDDWEIEKSVDYLLAQVQEMRRSHPGEPVAVIADGEVSSPVRGNGVGGRNSAFVLACVRKIAGEKIAVLSAGTDGIDGNSPAAGAVADGETKARADAAGLDVTKAYDESDAYSFFKKLGDTVVTGPTGNNLRDLRILLSE
jgi:hydroxypyruvate reductase